MGEYVSRNLDSVIVSDLKDRFRIPNYQRGYRWERKQIIQLLDDISNSNDDRYYLQPVTVAPCTDAACGAKYDIIDGQQRLTSIYIIYKALAELKEQYKGLGLFDAIDATVNYSLCYETRGNSEDFLNNLASQSYETAKEEIDTLYIYHAYMATLDWFRNNMVQVQTIAKALSEKVCIIWYEIDLNVDCWEKFASLNIGQIKLTNAELIKALFLKESNKSISPEEKNIIVDQWDYIERELHNVEFWSFLTNKPEEKYPTRIELLFDIIARKKDNDNDNFSTFYYFEKILSDKKGSQKKEWENIYIDFLTLMDWYKDREYYHLIGYLVTVNNSNLIPALLDKSKDKETTKSQFKEYLKSEIKKSIDFSTLWLEELTYDSNYSDILKVLTLFNVLSVQELSDSTQRYPFHYHKNIKGGWSLEHIHAQLSESLNRKEQWIQWMISHLRSLRRYQDIIYAKLQADASNDALQQKIKDIVSLKERMESFIKNDDKKQVVFNDISLTYGKTVVSLGESNGFEYKDQICNLALLGKDDNSLLNNSTFDVKREIITKTLTISSFIPLCTQRVFFKSYTPIENTQIFFWSQEDRDAYIDAMKSVLSPYLRNLPEQFRRLLRIKNVGYLWDTLIQNAEEYNIEIEDYLKKLFEIKSGEQLKDTDNASEVIVQKFEDYISSCINDGKEINLDLDLIGNHGNK